MLTYSSATVQVHVFVGGVEEKLMANKAIKQAVEVMMNPGGKMSRVQEILRRASVVKISVADLAVAAQCSGLMLGLVLELAHRLTCIPLQA